MTSGSAPRAAIDSDNNRIFDRKSTIARLFAEPITFITGRSQSQSFRSAYRRVIAFRVTPNEKNDRAIKPAAIAIAIAIAFSDRAVRRTKIRAIQ